MPTHQDVQADTAAPPRLGGDLQHLALETDGVVTRDDALLLVAQDGVEIDEAEGGPRRSWSNAGPPHRTRHEQANREQHRCDQQQRRREGCSRHSGPAFL
jgi:hypothetical protein